MDWSESRIHKLRNLWGEGLPTAEIGRRMGISKNAVVGKAHRLGLAGCPSPLPRSGNPVVRAPRRRAPVKLPAPASVPAALFAPTLQTSSLERQPAVRGRGLGRFDVSSGPAYCWPIGTPGTPNFRFCEAAVARNRPYCDEHAALAYVRVKERADRQAA